MSFLCQKVLTVRFQTSHATANPHNTCPPLSASAPHASQGFMPNDFKNYSVNQWQWCKHGRPKRYIIKHNEYDLKFLIQKIKGLRLPLLTRILMWFIWNASGKTRCRCYWPMQTHHTFLGSKSKPIHLIILLAIVDMQCLDYCFMEKKKG